MTVGRNLGVYIWMALSYNLYFGWEKDEWMDGWMNWKREGKITEGSFLNVSGVWYNINWEKPQRKKIYIVEAVVLLAIFFGTIIQREGRALSMGWGVFPITLKGNKLMENHLPLVLSGSPVALVGLPQVARCLLATGRLKISCGTELGFNPHWYLVWCFHR